MSSPSNWRSEPARTLAASLNIDFTRQVCPKCRKDITRCLGDDIYAPRWDKPNKKSICSVLECTDAILASLGKPKDFIKDALRRAKLEVAECDYISFFSKIGKTTFLDIFTRTLSLYLQDWKARPQAP